MSEQQRFYGDGRFEATGILGHGGFGIVYLALDLNTRRQVALKVPHEQYVTNRGMKARLKNEGRVLAMFDHPMLPTVWDCQARKGYPYIAIELIEGPHLAHCLKQMGVLPPRLATRLMIDLATALGVIHNHPRRILHRDVKPDNIYLRYKDGSLVLADFGLAKILGVTDTANQTLIGNLTRTAGAIGTWGFMNEAQSEGDVLDERADFFALGVTLWCLLTNPPMVADDKDHTNLAKKWRKWEVASTEHSSFADVPVVLRPILVACFQGNYRDAGEIVRDLTEAKEQLGADESEQYLERLRAESTQNQTLIPMTDSLDDIDIELASEGPPPSDLDVGYDPEDDDEIDDDEDDDEGDEALPEVTRTDPGVRRRRRFKKFVRYAAWGVMAAIALIAVTYALTVKNSLLASTSAPAPAPLTASVPYGEGPSSFTQTVAGFDSALSSSRPIVSEIIPPAEEFRTPLSVPAPTPSKAVAVKPKKVTAPVASPAPLAVTAEPAEAPKTGRVKVIGAIASRVIPTAGGSYTSLPADVPVGSYSVEVRLSADDSWKPVKTVSVTIGGTAVIRCDAVAETCN